MPRKKKEKLATKKGTPGIGRGNKKVSDEILEEALIKASGLVTAAARLLGQAGIKIHRRAIQDRIDRSPHLQDIVKDGNELRSDDAVISLHKAIKNGEGWAVCFQLKCMAKDRGYIERQVVDVNGNIKMQATGEIHVLRLPDNGRD